MKNYENMTNEEKLIARAEWLLLAIDNKHSNQIEFQSNRMKEAIAEIKGECSINLTEEMTGGSPFK